MQGRLRSLVDVELFQSMLDNLNDFLPFPSSIIDPGGEVFDSVDWKENCICVDINVPQSFRKCGEKQDVTPQWDADIAPTKIFRCGGGLHDCITPIVVEGEELGVLYTGRFFLNEPDLAFFKNKARSLGLEESEFLGFVRQTPVLRKERLIKYLSAIHKFVLIVQDIASKNLSEIKIRQKITESEERFRMLFNASPDAIFLADAETGIIIDANEAASVLLGRPISELIGLHQSDLHPKRNEDFTKRSFEEHAGSYSSHEPLQPVYNMVIRPDGTEIPVEISGRMLIDHNRKIVQGVFRDVSKRHEIEVKLKESEEKHRTLTENLPEIVARFDRNLRHLYVNPVVEKITGRSSADFIGKTNEELGMPKENVNFWNSNLRYVFETGRQHSFEFTFSNGEGTRYFSTLLVPEFDANEQVVSILSVARDITPLTNSRKSLKIQRDISLMLSESRDLHAVLGKVLEFAFMLDGFDSGGLYLVSPSTGELTLEVHRGLTSKFVAANTRFSKDSVNAVIVNTGTPLYLSRDEIGGSNDPFLIEEKIRSLAVLPILYKDKAIACLNLASHRLDEIPQDNKIVVEAIASNLGGTIQRIRTEDQLRESEIKYKLAFDTSPDAININTFDGVYVDINQGFTSLMGYGREIIGKSSLELNIWEYPEDRAKLIEGLRRDGLVANLESVFRAKDGTLRTALMSANLITINNTPHILSISRDISERKKIEVELREAKEKAEESNRLKTAFLANLSHELRTPMNGILGFADLLDDDTLSPETRHEYISVINDSGQSLLEVITNLMDISKIDSRQIESRFRNFSLNALLEEVLKWFKGERIVREKSQLTIEVIRPLADEDSFITTDPGKIRHILSLLLNNAAKFTNAGMIRFGYALGEEGLTLFVEDTGKGISTDKIVTIFERFRQEDETLSRKYGGLGLGLTIAKGLVDLLDGKIGVESEPGKGSRFWFKIPVR